MMKCWWMAAVFTTVTLSMLFAAGVFAHPASGIVVNAKGEVFFIHTGQGMFEKNTLTFNPGWDHACNTLPDFDDVRDIQKSLMSQGLDLLTQADESSTGPASFLMLDPDGNAILIDQHVPTPRS
jgi:hypothetical protein